MHTSAAPADMTRPAPTATSNASVADQIPQWFEGGTPQQMLDEALAQIRKIERERDEFRSALATALGKHLRDLNAIPSASGTRTHLELLMIAMLERVESVLTARQKVQPEPIDYMLAEVRNALTTVERMRHE